MLLFICTEHAIKIKLLSLKCNVELTNMFKLPVSELSQTDSSLRKILCVIGGKKRYEATKIYSKFLKRSVVVEVINEVFSGLFRDFLNATTYFYWNVTIQQICSDSKKQERPLWHIQETYKHAQHTTVRYSKNSTITTIVLFFEKDKKKKIIKKNTDSNYCRIKCYIILRSFPFSFIGFISTVQCYKNRGFQPDKALNISLFSSFYPLLRSRRALLLGKGPHKSQFKTPPHSHHQMEPLNNT